MSSDNLRRSQAAIESVLEAYGVPWQHTRRSTHSGYEFTVNGKTLFFTYGGGGDFRAPMNNRSRLRQMLNSMGMQPIKPEEYREEPVAPNGHDQPSEQENPMQTEPEPQPEIIEAAPEIVEVPETPPVIETPPASSPVPQQLPIRAAATYRSPRVLGIVLDRDLLVSAGNVLVIPLNKPSSVVEMSQEQFRVLFEAFEDAPRPFEHPPASEPPPAAVFQAAPAATPMPTLATETGRPSDDINNIIAYLMSRRGAVKTETIAAALNKTRKSVDGHMRRLVIRGVVQGGPPGFWDLVNRPGMPTGKPGAPTRPRGALVPPQLGRILFAMAQARKVTGKEDISPQMAEPFLNPADNRQFGARMPGAIEKGVVERGLPYPDRRGYHYKLTPHGTAVLKEIRGWPWEVDKLTTPVWAAQLP